MLLTIAFVIVGLSAALLIPRRLLKGLVGVAVLVVGVYTGAVILHARDGKPWTTLFASTQSPTPPPISKDEFWENLKNPLDEANAKDLVEQVRQRKVSFQLTGLEILKVRRLQKALNPIDINGLIGAIYENQFAKPVEPILNGPAPTFGEDVPDEVIVSLGDHGFIHYKKTPALRHSYQYLFAPDDSVMGYVYLEGNTLYFDTWFSDSDSLDLDSIPRFQIVRNKVLNLPPLWDFNFSQAALEIVDEKQKPQLQLIYKQPYHIVLKGIIHSVKGGFYLMDEGVREVPAVPKGWTLKPIFKYPAWKYRGVTADQ
jgi:hypothetical protein